MWNFIQVLPSYIKYEFGPDYEIVSHPCTRYFVQIKIDLIYFLHINIISSNAEQLRSNSAQKSNGKVGTYVLNVCWGVKKKKVKTETTEMAVVSLKLKWAEK